jgi:hypothetical protein
VSFELPKISEPPTSQELRRRVLMRLALMAAGNGKPSKNGTPKEAHGKPSKNGTPKEGRS